MKINITKFKQAAAKKRAADQIKADPEKAKAVRILVELAPFYGYRTVRKLLKYVRGEKIRGLPLRRTPTKKQAFGFKGHAIAELNSYAEERQATLLNELNDVSVEEIKWVLENISKSRLESRYRSRHFCDGSFGRVTLKKPRSVEINTDGRKINAWLRRSKKSVEERKQKQKEAKRQARREAAQKKHHQPKRLTTRAYVTQILNFNKALEPRYFELAHK